MRLPIFCSKKFLLSRSGLKRESLKSLFLPLLRKCVYQLCLREREISAFYYCKCSTNTHCGRDCVWKCANIKVYFASEEIKYEYIHSPSLFTKAQSCKKYGIGTIIIGLYCLEVERMVIVDLSYPRFLGQKSTQPRFFQRASASVRGVLPQKTGVTQIFLHFSRLPYNRFFDECVQFRKFQIGNTEKLIFFCEREAF